MGSLSGIKAAALLNVEISYTYTHKRCSLPRCRLRADCKATANLGRQGAPDARANNRIYEK